jgi:rhodanese-related sulfurtransferase
VPFETIERQLPELLPYQNQTVLVYGDSSTDGAVAAKLLSVAGFRNVVHISGGLAGWIERGYRTVNSQ